MWKDKERFWVKVVQLVPKMLTYISQLADFSFETFSANFSRIFSSKQWRESSSVTLYLYSVLSSIKHCKTDKFRNVFVCFLRNTRRVNYLYCFGNRQWCTCTEQQVGDGSVWIIWPRQHCRRERNEQHFCEKKELAALNNKIIHSYHAQHYAQSLITKFWFSTKRAL